MHWVDVVAAQLLTIAKEHVIASGTSISGQIHLGNAGDVIIAHAIARAVKEHGGKAELIWIRDDVDALRSVPAPLPPEFSKYLGMPVAALPCPLGCCSSFVEHFTKPFVNALHDLGIKPKIYSDYELYKTGAYEHEVKVALSSAREIIKIFKEVSGAEKPSKWLPFEPICERCGKIATTHAYDFDGKNIFYKCVGGVAGKKKLEGCGYEGSTNLRNGKLAWRVEWSARWKFLRVTCEPFGKEHSAAGGSYETAKLISEQIFNYPPPKPVFYEHILVHGRKMSKSLGNIITTEEVLSLAEPQVAKYLFFRTKPTKHKDIDLKLRLLKLIQDYERAERIYYDIEKIPLKKELPDIKRSYELAQVDKPSKEFFQVDYLHLAILVQVAKNFSGVLEILARQGMKIGKAQAKKLKDKYLRVVEWLSSYAPDKLKFKLQEALPLLQLTAQQKEFLKNFHYELKTISWLPEKLHNKIHELSKGLGIEPSLSFSAIYQIMLGRSEGPRAGYLLASLNREFVLQRIKEAIGEIIS